MQPADFQSLLNQVIAKVEGWVEAIVLMAPNLAVALLVLAMGYLLSLGARFVLSRALSRLTRGTQLCSLLTTVGVIAVRGTALFIALGVLDLDCAVTSLLAGVGVVGLALGFAFQDIAANFMSGLMMAFPRPFRIGDQVEVGGKMGRVEATSLRSTTITTLDGLTVAIPNQDVFQSPITNYTKTQQRRVDIELGVAYDSDLEHVQKVVSNAVEEVPHRDRKRRPEVYFTGFGGSAIDLVARVWLLQPDQKCWFEARSKAITAIKAAFDDASISIPFPIRTLDFGAASVGGQSLRDMNVPLNSKFAVGERRLSAVRDPQHGGGAAGQGRH